MRDERQGHPENQPLPGSVSDQNGEEAEPGLDGQDAKRRPTGPAGGGDDRAGGESGEGSQSSGDPNSAG
ncbi:MAG: hypothetical protein ACR2NR_18665 [Solirubrobacteraceae bacterium]